MRRTPFPTLLIQLCGLLSVVLAATLLPALQAQAQSTGVPTAGGQERVAARTGTYVPAPGAYFSSPNRSKAAKMAIRGRVLNTIKSTVGGPRTSIGTPTSANGTIRIATWSFDDWAVARALVAARKRGVSVQVVAAKAANKKNRPWKWLRKRLGSSLYRPGYPSTRETVSFARVCKGSCRGPGGTAHAKYFLFDKVGPRRARYVTVQTSMNLTRFAYTSQWNQAQVMNQKAVYDDFLGVFRQSRLGQPVRNPYRARPIGSLVVDYFFPRPRANASQDPIMQNLRLVGCTAAGAGGTPGGRTRIRIIQYAMYGDRGVWIAKRLRALWNAGCDVRMIYSLVTRPVLQIMRNRSGRGPIPMRQSVIKNGAGEISKYNHSKWMTITGRWNGRSGQWVTFTGSANWALLNFGSDDQMQRIRSRGLADLYLRAFEKTWKQKSSKRPPGGRLATFGRTTSLPGVPEDEPAWGEGVYRYMRP